MKKQFLLFALLVLPLVVSADESGWFGDNVTYTYVEATNTLTISGTGAMTDNSDYFYNDPWYSFRSSIKTVIINNGVTSIRDYAFRDCSSLTSVNIPNSVTTIGERAFWGCSGLTSVTIPNSVTSIGVEAFCGCSDLTSVTIPNSVTSIEAGAFANCSGLTSVTIPNSVTSIEVCAFYDCSALTSITIPNSVTSIGDYAFDSCSGLTSVTFPQSVTSSSSNAFLGCIGLTSLKVVVSDLSTFCNNKVIGLINSNIGKPITLVDNGGNEIKEYVIPDGVMSIGDGAFQNCSGLTSVTIPNSVTSIGDYTFRDCSGLTSVTIPNSVTSIGGDAFGGCSGLTSLTIPNSVTSVGLLAFGDCSGLTSMKVVVSDLSTFCNNKVIGLINSNIGKPITLVDNGGNEIKEYVIPDGVTSIGDYAFQNCTGLTSVTIPNSVTSIGASAFQGCSLTSVEFHCKEIGNWFNGMGINKVIIGDEVTSIGDYAFYGCSGLTSVTIPNSVTSFGSSAFSDCSSLTSVTIPNSVTSIGDYAFQNCSGLTSIAFPQGVTSFGSDPFSGCSGLTSLKVVVSDLTTFCNNQVIGLINSNIGKPITLVDNGGNEIKEYVIPDGVTSIGDYAFQNCSGLTSVIFPQSVTSFGSNYYSNPFSGCSGLTSLKVVVSDLSTFCNNQVIGLINSNIGKPTTLVDNGGNEIKDYVIPDGVTSIGNYAFQNCSGLTSVTIPNSMTSIGYGAFWGCSLTSVEFHCKEIGNWFRGMESINEAIIGDEVTSIGNSAFSNCSGLTSIIIPNSVTSIGNYAFQYCSGLTSVTIPNSVTSIGDFAFQNCYGLTSVAIPNTVTSIGSGAFSYCSGLTSFTIPNSVTSIGTGAFSYCSGLTSFAIPNSVTNIGNRAFSGCSGLTSIDLHCNTIGDCFSGNTSVTSILIGDEVTSINDNAFNGCKNLATIEIGKSVTNVGMRAFANIDKLNEVKCYVEDVPTTDRTAFENSYTDYATLYVPYASVDKYKAVGPWNGFKIISKLVMPEHILTYKVDNVEYKTYTIEEGTIITPEASPSKVGYTFSGWSGIPSTMPNHDVTVTGTFSVDVLAPITIQVENKERVYGEPNPDWTYTVIGGAIYGDGKPKVSCVANTKTSIGTYPITIEKGTVSNKNVNYMPGTLTITKAPLTIAANSYRIKIGKPLPNYTVNYTGFKNGETETVLSQQPTVTCAATAASEPGKYEIVVSSAAADNYEISYVNGELVILADEPGDLNDDGEIDVTDVVELIDMVLSGTYDKVADINGDGEVDVTDVVELIDMVLSGE